LNPWSTFKKWIEYEFTAIKEPETRKERSVACRMYGSFDGLSSLICSNIHKNVARVINSEPHLALLKGYNQQTLLMHTIQGCAYECFDILIDNGAASTVNDIDISGNTALIMAAKYNIFDMARKLIENGADVTIRNNEDESFFSYAMKHEKDIDLWIRFYPIHKDVLDDKDLELLKAYRLHYLFT
jgi:hypothetical protein